MKIWNERPFEVRNLFNPAFCGVTLLRAMEGFEEQDKSGMPFSLAFLILPLCLHKESRAIFTSNSRSYLLKIISQNPELLLDFSQRAKMLLPHTLEGLGISMERSLFYVTDDGRLKLSKKTVRKRIDGSIESIEIQKVAKILGKGFARIGDRVTIYSSFGVRP
jgi:hypothetical protein